MGTRTRKAKRRQPDRRIEAIDVDDGAKVVLLRAGFAYQDANTPNACHTFGADTVAEIKQTMRLVEPCACPDCVKALASGGSLWT